MKTDRVKTVLSSGARAVVLVLGWAMAQVAVSDEAPSRPAIEVRPVFQGGLPWTKPGGGEATLQVEISRRNLAHGARLEIPSRPGVTLVQLRGGHVKVSEKGKTSSPRVDDFWVADPMGGTTIEATSEEAVIEIVEATPPR